MAMARALLLLALVACAQALPLDSAAEGAGYKLFGQLLDFMGLSEDLPAATKGTLFAPSDAAINKWLSDMQGMTLAELLDRPQLVDQLVSYHFVPGLTITESKKAEGLISKDASDPDVLWTGDIDSTLRLSRSPTTGLLRLQDAQGNKVSVVSKKPTMDGQVAIWGISSVLFSKSYFDSHNDALKAFPQFSTSYELSNIATHSSSKSAALNAALASGAQTFLIPTNKAWGASGKQVAFAKPDTLVSLFEYHTLPGIRTVPAGFKSGAAVETALKSHTVKTWINDAITRTNAYTGETVPAPLLTVVPEVGKPAQAIYPNIFAGKDVIHGLDRTLTPYGVPSLLANAGRRLMQSSTFRRQNSGMLSSSNTQAAIRAAARGQVPVSTATRIGSMNARSAGAGSRSNRDWLRWNSVV